ncbi:Na+/H+ antiporter NhaA [Frankia sp. AgKG'84/4]
MSRPPPPRAPVPAPAAVPWRWPSRDGFTAFLRAATAGGLLLLAATVAALVWANLSPGGYRAVWDAPAGLGPAALRLDGMRLADWVADGLLSVFFLAIGVELRRELTVGALAGRHRAVLPIAAAAGGMLGPALLCFALTHDTAGAGRAWAIPVATDAAFAVGVLALAGSRAPAGLRTLLLGLAVADDLGAMVILATVFHAGLALGWLPPAVLLLAAAALAHHRGHSHPALHVPLAVAAWSCVHAAGLNPTVAGAALGLAVPARARAGRAHAPAERLESLLGPVCAVVVLPLFALSATGVPLTAHALRAVAADPVSRAVAISLVVGKLLGVPAGAWLAHRFGARFPDGLRGRHLIPLGLLAGIGYTVSLLLARLALPEPQRVEAAATAILAASLTAAVLALLALRTPLAAVRPAPPEPPAAARRVPTHRAPAERADEPPSPRSALPTAPGL